MRWRPTPQLLRLATLGSVVMVAGLVLGRIEIVAIGSSLLAALGPGLLRRAPSLSARLVLADERVLEGEVTQLTVLLTADGRVDQANVEVTLAPGLAVVDGAARVTVDLRAGGTRSVTIGVRPVRWGVHRVGPGHVTAYARGRLVARAVPLAPMPLRVLPRAERFAAASAHPFTRVVTGSHVSRAAGEGIEFAGIREFRPGDPLRRVNWRVSSRTNALHVTEHRPERNAEVVLFLDTFVDAGPPGESSLDVSVRAALGIAAHYLAQMDRVGVTGFGGVIRWLTAATGSVQFHRVVEHLLGTELVMSYSWKDIELLPAHTLPPRALVFALSPLLDTRATGALADLARRGFGVVVVDTSPEPLLPPPSGEVAALAQRIFSMEREMTIGRLSDIGVPVVRWTGAGSLDAVLLEVSRLHSRPRLALR
ncbi:MAG: DUF58 domain-containing protein [Mycobacteriales bacterium]